MTVTITNTPGRVRTVHHKSCGHSRKSTSVTSASGKRADTIIAKAKDDEDNYTLCGACAPKVLS